MTADSAAGHKMPIDGKTSRGSEEETRTERPQSLMETVSHPDPNADPAKEIEEKGEPFEGNHA